VVVTLLLAVGGYATLALPLLALRNHLVAAALALFLAALEPVESVNTLLFQRLCHSKVPWWTGHANSRNNIVASAERVQV
jgi:hypothetical protein